MPSYVYTHDETKPAGSRALSLGDDDIRELKAAFRERLATDHQFAADETGITTIGYHKHATLIDKAGNPATVTGAGIIFAKTISGRVELCYWDDAGNLIQLTRQGVINDSVAAKTGDWMLSSVTTARTGWTNVSSTYANKFMRINGTPLTTGGSDTHSHTGPSHQHTATPNTLTEAGGGGGQTFADDTAFNTGASGTGVTSTSDNIPAYVQVCVFQKD